MTKLGRSTMIRYLLFGDLGSCFKFLGARARANS